VTAAAARMPRMIVPRTRSIALGEPLGIFSVRLVTPGMDLLLRCPRDVGMGGRFEQVKR
jgi:hypothetical protein